MNALGPNVRVYLAKLADIIRSVPLGEDDFERLAKITHPRRRRTFCAGRALARSAIEASSGMRAALQRFQTTANGRPVCIDGPAISISHSGNWAACAVASQGDVGLDLQFPVARVAVDEIATWCFADDEREWLAEEAGRDRFFRLWVLKEAHVKVSGAGLFGGLGRLSCRVDPPRIHARFHPGPETHLALYSFQRAYLGLATTTVAAAPIEVSLWEGGVWQRRDALKFCAATAARGIGASLRAEEGSVPLPAGVTETGSPGGEQQR